MKNVLITGASGNVGMSVIKALSAIKNELNIVAGIRDLAKEENKFYAYDIPSIKFDFMDSSTFSYAFNHCDVLFLLRPPQISNVNKYFIPLINSAKIHGVKHIVFLSVQGVEKSTIIPHNKIEKLIIASKIPYTFLRPAYFMQNFTTTLQSDLVENRRIYLPAGDSKFTLVDVDDIGRVAAIILSNVIAHTNKSYELTCNEKLTFQEMAKQLSNGLGVKIKYISPNLIRFFITKRKEKMPVSLILVMIMLHYLPRFQKEPQITDCIKRITGKEPISFQQFVNENNPLLIK